MSTKNVLEMLARNVLKMESIDIFAHALENV